MAQSDTILFVKETKTCSYILVINTPRLCGEPGFRSRQEIREQATISCREIVSPADDSKTPPLDLKPVPNMDYPNKIPMRRQKKLAPPPSTPSPEEDASKKPNQALEEMFQKVFNGEDALVHELDETTLRQILEAAGVDMEIQVIGVDGVEKAEFVYAIGDDTNGGLDAQSEARLKEVLLAAGFDLQVSDEDEDEEIVDDDVGAQDERLAQMAKENRERRAVTDNREVHAEDEDDRYYDAL